MKLRQIMHFSKYMHVFYNDINMQVISIIDFSKVLAIWSKLLRINLAYLTNILDLWQATTNCSLHTIKEIIVPAKIAMY